MELKRVVVTGLGAVTPVGNSPEETWENLLAGKSGAAPITHFDSSLFKTQFACEIKNLNINDYIDRKEARKLDRYTQLAMISAMQGVKDSGLDLDKVDKNRIGVVYGVGIGGIKTFEDEVSYYGKHSEDGPKFNPFFIPKMIADIASGQISIHFGFHGPNYTTTSACASSSNAIADAFNLIRLGKANVIVSGGAEAAICACGVGGFNAMKALSTRNDDPERASRPFSASRDGFVMGEGAGCIVLEELEHAKARGAKIYAEMVGEGESADAYHITASHPEGLGAKLVMERALEDAGMKPEDIDYINVHGTSTHVGDISEAKAIKDVFGESAYKLNISSTKSMTGHLLGAAGAVEAMVCILAVKNDIIPPTINHDDDDLDPELDYNLNFTFNKAQKREVRAALSNTFGFGGHNACVIDRIKLPFRKEKELYSSLFDIIGFYPHDISFYKLALMHKSVMRRNAKGKPVNNERLEFLGDAILDAIVGDIVYQHFPGKREGFLTNTRSKLVQRDTLNKLAQEMGINQLILSSGHSSSHNSYMGGNAFEALVGAIYLDQGYDACMRFMSKRILAKMINIDKVAYKEVNFKSKLIEWAQKNKVRLTYELVKQDKDKSGNPIFEFKVMMEGIEGCSAKGFSKKESQQAASKLTLEKLRRKPQFIDQIFEAKANRTKMEEMPVETVPNTEVKEDFIIVQNDTIQEEAPQTNEEVQPQAIDIHDSTSEEFDLSDISSKPQSREDIIAAAEEKAFAEV